MNLQASILAVIGSAYLGTGEMQSAQVHGCWLTHDAAYVLAFVLGDLCVVCLSSYLVNISLAVVEYMALSPRALAKQKSS